jgi:hypothetical protein
MLTLKELVELRDNLINDKIDITSAKNHYFKDFKEGQRSWHTKDWKKRRAEFIKDKCQICTSTDTLTLQHLSHPKKYAEYEIEVATLYARDYIQTNSNIDIVELSNYIQEKYDYLPIPLCPHCKSRNPNKRIRKVPQYLCTDCKLEFDDVVYLSVDELIEVFYKDDTAIEVRDKCFVTRDKWMNKHNFSNIIYWMKREEVKFQNTLAIQKEALLNCLNDNIKYLSFEETITACKKCAAYYDLYDMELCPKCKVYYKGMKYLSCIPCLPVEKRKSAMEKVDLGIQLRDMEKKFGID